MSSSCIIGIAGYSGSGKTTLIRKILPELKKQGLSVGILKHVHHNLNIDIRGKDTDFFYRAGADFVFAHDAKQGFARYRSSDNALSGLIRIFPPALDLILIEGHKDINIPGIWLKTGADKNKTESICFGNRKIVFRDAPHYEKKALTFIQTELKRFHAERPLLSGLLVGGKSLRMGTPKTLLKIKKMTLAERSFNILSDVSQKTLLLGSGPLPDSLQAVDRLADVCGVGGPVSGLLSAFRWAPESTWIISSVDMPLMNKEALAWLLRQRKPGVWAVLPKIKGSKGVETTGAVYEPMIFAHIESLARDGNFRLQDIAAYPKIITPLIPKDLAPAWRNVNTPTDWEKVLDRNARKNRINLI